MDWTHGGEFPVANISRVQTVGMQQMHAQFSRLIRPHEISLTDRRRDFVSELRYAPLSRSVLSSAVVGASMRVRARPDGDVCLVFGAVNVPLRMTIGSRRAVIPVGAIDVVPPEVPFEIDIPHGDCRSMMFEVERAYLETVIAEETGCRVSEPLCFANDGSRHPHGERGFVGLLQFVKDELTEGTVRCGSRAYLARLEGLVAAALLYAKPHNYSNCLQRNEGAAEPGCVRRAEDYMRANAGNDLTLTLIAAVAAVSPRTLIRSFRRYKDCSPMSYLRNLRLDYCQRDLTGAVPEDTSVTAVAAKWGFFNAGRFARLYRQRYGENPVDTLRRKSRKGS